MDSTALTLAIWQLCSDSAATPFERALLFSTLWPITSAAVTCKHSALLFPPDLFPGRAPLKLAVINIIGLHRTHR
jgi:hypothetical protein